MKIEHIAMYVNDLKKYLQNFFLCVIIGNDNEQQGSVSPIMDLRFFVAFFM